MTWDGLTPPYRTIVADPPWQSRVMRGLNGTRKPEAHYSTMSLDEIKALPVGDLADVDVGCHLWLWTVNSYMGEAWPICYEWGFEPLTVLTWCKPQPGVGFYLRNNTEHCIFARRGKPMVPDEKAMSSWYVWPRGAHSAKPAAFMDIVETVSPAPRVELFARAPRLGWDSWGYGYESAVTA